MENMKCTAPNCSKVLSPEATWHPEWRAIAAANGGRRPPLVELNRFALCGWHGHLLRKEGVRVYRLSETLKRERDRREALASQGKGWQAFASKFAPKAKDGASAWRGARDDGRNLGGGLSRYVRTDAEKQTDAASEEPKTK